MLTLPSPGNSAQTGEACLKCLGINLDEISVLQSQYWVLGINLQRLLPCPRHLFLLSVKMKELPTQQSCLSYLTL